MQIDDRLRGRLPAVAPATSWASPDGTRTGWKVSLPGGRPLATPAVAGGRVFLGGGFGSYEFYALDANDGHLAWAYQTEDDGPTAAVVADGHVAFNTESCELEVLNVEGKHVWKQWLGDPLMSMPAVEGGRVFQANPDSRGDHRHYLGCFELATGNQLWKQPIPGEVITSPVLEGGRVYLTCLDGTLLCFDQQSGSQLWAESSKATTSPLIWKDRCYFAQRFETETPHDKDIWEIQQNEKLVSRGLAADGRLTDLPATATKADYLDLRKRRRSSPHWAACEVADAAVGFAQYKGDAKMHQAGSHLGHGHISSIWSYQGSRPFAHAGRLYSSLGQSLQCVDPGSGEVVWKRQLYESASEVLDNVLTPPVTVNSCLFTASFRGDVFCLDAVTGEVRWQAALGEPILFQPALAAGRLYVPTTTGTLYSLDTGDPADDGWLMWGATAAHNGLPDAAPTRRTRGTRPPRASRSVESEVPAEVL
jgi:outer membrane protein assembly factor BamB